ncbi:hypothetical protein AcV7_010314 [Taiwanofungus camphoratus]|nr:hypothetical protein AcV7_010314 [Antrodia cinnamomea]
MMCLDTVPHEILEHIGFFAATDSFLGPPAGVTALLAVSRRTNSALSIASNPHLWARIFAHKFDLASPLRRLGSDSTTALALATELRHRCILIRRIRLRSDTIAPTFEISRGHVRLLNSLLWMAYLMMLENDGKNKRQLLEYARIDEWLKEYLFHPSGASLIRWSVKLDIWPSGDDERNTLALWLFWFILKPDDYMEDDAVFRDAISVLKLIALGAHQYRLAFPSWRDFIPPYRLKDASIVPFYGSELKIIPPTPATPAILSYLTLVNKLPVSWDTISYMKPSNPTVPSSVVSADSSEWNAEWARGLHLADRSKPFSSQLSGAFIPGSLEGVWEGLFTYTDFTAYAALLSGASPTVLERSLVAQHPQLWKLHEYHLYASEEDDAGAYGAGADPMSPGNPLRGYIPNGAQLHEGPSGLEVREPGRKPVVYESWAAVRQRAPDERQRRVKDVFVTGEGHSAWGQFNLVGRVRPCDGFISLSKEYMRGERGRWLYRAYMVGNAHGNLSGRWRDTLSPPDVLGYEGCFMMSRRK